MHEQTDVDEITIIWRFNLADGIGADEFFAWLEANVWASTAEYGCRTTGFRCESDGHDWATIATWPSEADRKRWEHAEMASLPTYPGTEGAWGAQIDMVPIRLVSCG